MVKKKSQDQKYTDIDQVIPAHRHLSGQALSLDQINAIDAEASAHDGSYAEGYYKAKTKFAESHVFKNGTWSKK